MSTHGLSAAVVLACFFALTGHADEGLWLFNDPPIDRINDRYGVALTTEHLDRLRMASITLVKDGDVASSAVVSPNGLVVTNQHVAESLIGSVLDGEDIVNGFVAGALADEKRIPDLAALVLTEIVDVTARVNEKITTGMSPAEAEASRSHQILLIEQEANERPGTVNNVVELFRGARFDLYRYERHADVRVVFVPERTIANYGGDTLNFEYPRYSFDVSFFRIYGDDGRPAKLPNYLRWSLGGAKEGEFVTVTGTPQITNRQVTMAELALIRDVQYPFVLGQLFRWEVALSNWSLRSIENEQTARGFLAQVQNSRKARQATLDGLLDARLLAMRESQENILKREIESNPKTSSVIAAWDDIENAVDKQRRVFVRAALLDEYNRRCFGFNSQKFVTARQLVRTILEAEKPEGERLPGYSDDEIKANHISLKEVQTFNDDYEVLKLADSLQTICSELIYDDKAVQIALGTKSPSERARELVTETRIADVAFRTQLLADGSKAIAESNDPLIRLAKDIDPLAREVGSLMRIGESEKRLAYTKIASARDRTAKAGAYPDATFTPRLSYGRVRGYDEGGRPVRYATTFAELFATADKNKKRPVFELPPKWEAARESGELAGNINFVCDADAIVGNSGSPVVNSSGELVGVYFDGNIQSRVTDVLYSDLQARAISVDSKGVLSALQHVYKARRLIDELRGSNMP